MNTRIKAFLIAYIGMFVAGRIAFTINEIRQARKNTETLEQETELDIKAIKRASDEVIRLIHEGRIRSLDQLTETLNTEIKFQKIAIRED